MKTFSKEVFMNKEALAAKTILGMIGGGAALAGGGAAVGHRFGVRAGAERMGNEMATAFSEANAKENKSIVDSFKAFNKKENAILANQYLRKGVTIGYNMGSTKPPTSAPMSKSASDIAEAAFQDELEKLGFPIAGLARSAVSSVTRLSKGLMGAGKQLGRAYGTRGMAGRGIPALRKSYLSNASSMAGQAIKSSPVAAAAIGGTGLVGAGYAAGKPNPRRTIVEHRY